MPRPAPPSPLKTREIRMSDEQWEKFKELGGAAWLRRFIGGRPDGYYKVFQRRDQGAADGQQVVAISSSRRKDFAADAPVHRGREIND